MNPDSENLILIDKSEYDRLLLLSGGGGGLPDDPLPRQLREPECRMLHAIWSGDYDAVRISFKNREPDSMELVRSQRADRRIFEVLEESEFQNVEIVRHKGRVAKIVSTVKHKFRRG